VYLREFLTGSVAYVSLHSTTISLKFFQSKEDAARGLEESVRTLSLIRKARPAKSGEKGGRERGTHEKPDAYGLGSYIVFD
jgi:hypothetical protein